MDINKEFDKCTKTAEKKYFDGEISDAYKIFLKCEQLAIKINDPELIAESTKNIGRILHRMGKYEEAKEKYINALKMIKKLKLYNKMPRYLNHLANVHQYLLEFDEYYECLMSALDIAEKLKDQYLIAKIKNSTGVYYEVLGDYDRSLSYLETALKLYEEVGAPNYIFSGIYNMISSVLTKKNIFKKAIEYSEKAYNLSIKNRDLSNKAYALRNKIRALYLQEKYEESYKHLEELLKIKDKIENLKMKSEILRLIGQIYQKINQLNKSYKNFDESLKIAIKIKYYHGMAETYKALGELYHDAESYSEAFRNYSNSLTAYELILNSIKNPKMKEYYKKKFIDLPETIRRINDILENRPFEIKLKEVEKTSENVVEICKKLHNSDISENIANATLESTKQEKKTGEEIKKEREYYRGVWLKTLNDECFTNFDEETQDHLIMFKETLDKMPNDYRSCINKISDAIECELRIKFFVNYHEKILNELNDDINTYGLWKIDREFNKTLKHLKRYIKFRVLPTLGKIYYILSSIYNINSFHHIPETYLKPFKLFRVLIGKKNLKHIKEILNFLECRFKCGAKSYNFVAIRNSCSHGGKNKIQDIIRGNKIDLSEETIKSIENKLINEDTNLLLNLCTLEP